MPKKIITFILFLFVLSPLAFSVDGSNLNKPNLRVQDTPLLEKDKLLEKTNLLDKKREINPNQLEKVDQKCTQLEEKFDNRITNFAENKDSHIEKYNKVVERVTALVQKFKSLGLDVAQFEDDLNTFDQMVKDYAKLYAEFIDSLKFTRGFACGKSDGDFRDNMLVAKEKLLLVKEARSELREFYKDSIREDIKQLRLQLDDTEQEREQERTKLKNGMDKDTDNQVENEEE